MFAPLTVMESLQLGAYFTRDRATRRQRLDEVLALFPVLAERASVPSGLLSGGEQQMLAFGRALMSGPQIVLLDEPTMGLSPVMTDRIMAAVRDMAVRGMAVVVVEQNVAASLAIADHCCVMEQGRMVLSGAPSDIQEHPAMVSAFLGI
jgi:branched-chain amino acid transport system ATP-binding protein